MSVEIQWETLTTGSDGEQLAETVRAFIHEKFQQVTLPRFIRSVHVHAFHFGSVAPEIDIKDICDPLPEFYDEQDDSEEDDEGCHDTLPDDGVSVESVPEGTNKSNARVHSPSASARDTKSTAGNARQLIGYHDLPTSSLFGNLPTPGIPGGTSNMNYFHLPFGPGLSGTATPLAAVAGGSFNAGWSEHANAARSTPPSLLPHASDSVTSLTDLSTADPSSRPQSQHQNNFASSNAEMGFNELSDAGLPGQNDLRLPESSPNDIQVVAHVRYSGDLRLSLTAEILLDYPMPSFIGIPLQLNVTGLRFDGVAILAYIKKRAHVCFLSPEDAEAFVDNGTMSEGLKDNPHSHTSAFGGLLEEIKVESEIGKRDNGKQVLKNVGKVEKFILEQVRRILEDEFVYPSFWTFLV